MSNYRDGINDRAVEMLVEMGTSIRLGGGREQVAQQITARFCELFDADYCRIWWRTEDPNEVRVIAHHPPIEFQEEWEYKKRLDGTKGTVVKSIFVDGRLMIEGDPAAATEIESRYVTVYGAKSGVHIPIFIDGSVVGDLAMISKREKEHFDAEQTELFGALANVCAWMLGRA